MITHSGRFAAIRIEKYQSANSQSPCQSKLETALSSFALTGAVTAHYHRFKQTIMNLSFNLEDVSRVTIGVFALVVSISFLEKKRHGNPVSRFL